MKDIQVWLHGHKKHPFTFKEESLTRQKAKHYTFTEGGSSLIALLSKTCVVFSSIIHQLWTLYCKNRAKVRPLRCLCITKRLMEQKSNLLWELRSVKLTGSCSLCRPLRDNILHLNPHFSPHRHFAKLECNTGMYKTASVTIIIGCTQISNWDSQQTVWGEKLRKCTFQWVVIWLLTRSIDIAVSNQRCKESMTADYTQSQQTGGLFAHLGVKLYKWSLTQWKAMDNAILACHYSCSDCSNRWNFAS